MHHVSLFEGPCSPSLHRLHMPQTIALGSADHCLIPFHEPHELTTPDYCISIFNGRFKCSFVGPLFVSGLRRSFDVGKVPCVSPSLNSVRRRCVVLISWVPRCGPITPWYLCAFEAYLPRRSTNFALSDRSLVLLATLQGPSSTNCIGSR